MKLIIGSLVVFSLVILFLFALFPADISITRMIQIGTTPEKVHHEIADLRKWKNWNGLLLNSINQNEKDYTEPGLIDSNYISLGYLTIELQKSGADSIITRWKSGDKSFMSDFILFPQSNGQAILEWTLHFHLKWYPWEKLASMFYDKRLGPVMESSLVNLKNELEK